MDLPLLGRQATALFQQGRLAEAESLLRQILEANPRVFPALYMLGTLRLQLGDSAEAASLLERALALNPGDPGILMHHAMAVQAQGRAGDAIASYERVLAADPGNPDAWMARGLLLHAGGRKDEALESLDRAIVLQPDFAQALHHRGDMRWSDRIDLQGAISDLARALALEPDRPWLRGNLLHLKMYAADWTDFDQQVQAIHEGVRAAKPVVHPFIYQAIAQRPADLQACSRIYARTVFPPVPPLTLRQHRPDRIRLGYASGEFREQATAILMAGLYEAHDRSRFEVIALDHGGSDGSALRARLEKAFDRIIPIVGLDDASAAARIADAGIDILVNLNGYFGTPPGNVFALRPAPVQVGYLGFPATLGAPYFDYIVSDKTVLPEAEQIFYDEKIAWLPDTYWVNDNKRPIAGGAPGRADCGLPKEGFVFCNFNNSYKLTPECFALWLRILGRVDGSVLWLFEGNNPLFAQNLRTVAAAQGIDPERLVFAPLMPSPQHLARLRLVDLSLDSLPYNAHTTASDALWAGVPILTCRGTTWPGRVCASQLQAMDMPELITDNEAAFEETAVRLATNPKELAALKAKLARNRETTALFDTARLTANMEAAYQLMWDCHQRGEAPASFSV